MSEREYVDVREFLATYKRATCPRCGDEEWFKHVERDHDPDNWNCESCRRPLTEPVEVACPDCDTRMVFEGGWVCRACGAEREADKTGLIDRMTGAGDHRVGYVLGERCPFCKDGLSVAADPDGDAMCRECESFWVARFSDAWYAYAEWLRRRGPTGRHEAPAWIRVNEPEGES